MQIVIGSRTFTNLSFRKLRTFKGNLLIRMLYTENEVNSSLLFYIDPRGRGNRFVCPNELKNIPRLVEKKSAHPFLHYSAWTNAKETWTVERGSITDDKLLTEAEKKSSAKTMISVKEEWLNEREKSLALNIAEQVLRNPLFGFPDTVVDEVKRKIETKQVKKDVKPGLNLQARGFKALSGIKKMFTS